MQIKLSRREMDNLVKQVEMHPQYSWRGMEIMSGGDIAVMYCVEMKHLEGATFEIDPDSVTEVAELLAECAE